MSLFNPKLGSGLVLLGLLLARGVARAGEPDEDYLKIYSHIQEAESLESSGRTSQALTNFQQAYAELRAFQRIHPDWNLKVVNTRVSRLAAQIRALSDQPVTRQVSTNGSGGNARSGTGGAVRAGEPRLLEPGAEPRKVLRLHPKPGDRQTLDLTLKIAMASKMGPVEGPAIKMPPMKLTLEVTVKSVSAEGEITYEMVMSDASVVEEPGALPQMVELMKTAFSKAKGMSGIGTVSARGIGKAVDVKVPDGADPQSRQILDQLKEVFSGAIPPLPEEAVGPGAKWEVHTPSKTQGVQVEQTESYELVSMEGDRLKARTTDTERAGKQKVPSPAGATGSVDLTRLAGNGTGELTYDLAHLLPAEASAEQHRETTMNMGSGTQRQTVTQKLDLSVRAQAREDSPTPAGTSAPQKQ